VSRWRNEHGFTLAELLTAFAVLALVLAGVVMIYWGGLQAYVSGSHKTEAQQNARVALERMARQIRKTTTTLTTATATSISFTLADPVTLAPTAITYALNGNNLACTGLCNEAVVNPAPQTVIGGVQVLAFAYRDASNAVLAAPVANPGNVRRVDITIQTGTEDPSVVAGGIGDTRTQVTTSVRLRNL